MRATRFRPQPVGLSLVVAAAIALVAVSPGVGAAQEEEGRAGSTQRLDPPLGPVNKFVNRELIKALTQKLVRINSEYEYPDILHHKEIAAVLAAELKSIGMQVEVVAGDPTFPGAVGRLKGPGGKPPL